MLASQRRGTVSSLGRPGTTPTPSTTGRTDWGSRLPTPEGRSRVRTCIGRAPFRRRGRRTRGSVGLPHRCGTYTRGRGATGLRRRSLQARTALPLGVRTPTPGSGPSERVPVPRHLTGLGLRTPTTGQALGMVIPSRLPVAAQTRSLLGRHGCRNEQTQVSQKDTSRNKS